MLSKLREAGLVWPTLAALAGLAVLIGLGTWQMERKRWKEDLIAKLAAGAHADPVLFPPQITRREPPPETIVLTVPEAKQADVFRQWIPEYRHVSTRGRFHHDKERYLYAPAPAGLGWHVYTPLELPSQDIVWVNRGFVPDARKAPATRPDGQVQGEVEVRGLVRYPAGPSVFAAQNDPAHNLWYWPDLPAMTASAFAGSPLAAKTLPLVIEADAEPEPPGGLPRGGVTRLRLPNRHLEYALTWYGLAATLVSVYLAFAISRLRAPT